MSFFAPISFESMKVGKIIKSSKMRFIWKFLLDNLDYTVTMFHSKISTKVKILVNGEIVLCTKATEQHIYKFNIRYRQLLVFKTGDIFDLKCENYAFANLLANPVHPRPTTIKRNSAPRVQLRRSLPCALPDEVPSICFRKKVKEVDLLGMASNNPFDMIEEEDDVRMCKTADAFSKNNNVPWPKESPIGYNVKRFN